MKYTYWKMGKYNCGTNLVQYSTLWFFCYTLFVNTSIIYFHIILYSSSLFVFYFRSWVSNTWGCEESIWKSCTPCTSSNCSHCIQVIAFWGILNLTGIYSNNQTINANDKLKLNFITPCLLYLLPTAEKSTTFCRKFIID